ncbi:MAG: type 4a pilus biogenesis protein PilO [Azoarcus sp.]|jgi:type IV pilus assembly protein PilO|nr:type 4a pilus biogenesis protein PilO [Azoarcus sp.]
MAGLSLQRLQDDFRGLDPNDPGVWPLAPKVIVFVALLVLVVAGWWYFDWQDQQASLEQKQREELDLRETWRGKKSQAVNIDEYKRQLADIDRQFGTLLRQLPGKAEMESLLSDINQAGLGRGLQFDLFQPTGDQIREFYAAVPVKINVTGSYHDLGAFAADVAKMPRIVTIRDINLSIPSQQGKNVAVDTRLKLDAKAETYRYLEKDEGDGARLSQGGRK